MTRIRSSVILGAALVIGSICSAQAADLYNGGGSMKDGHYEEESHHASWYVRGDVAYGHHDDPIMVEEGRFDLVSTSIDRTWSIGGGIGHYFNHKLRGDLTYDYRFDTDVSGTKHSGDWAGERKFGLKSHVFLANLYYDFNREGRFNPYLGVGLGFVHHKTEDSTITDGCGCTATLKGATERGAAAAAMAGISIKMRDKLHMDAGYRFLYLGKAHTGDAVLASGAGAPAVIGDPTVEGIQAHEIRIGLRYDFR